ncbi:MAG: hypothetical protein LBM96_10945 [Methanobrevibacter sp.]|nr:hypothetical protein [Candidatus Methanoflexus mossambicus]
MKSKTKCKEYKRKAVLTPEERKEAFNRYKNIFEAVEGEIIHINSVIMRKKRDSEILFICKDLEGTLELKTRNQEDNIGGYIKILGVGEKLWGSDDAPMMFYDIECIDFDVIGSNINVNIVMKRNS